MIYILNPFYGHNTIRGDHQPNRIPNPSRTKHVLRMNSAFALTLIDEASVFGKSCWTNCYYNQHGQLGVKLDTFKCAGGENQMPWTLKSQQND